MITSLWQRAVRLLVLLALCTSVTPALAGFAGGDSTGQDDGTGVVDEGTLVPWEDIKVWGDYLPSILAALDEMESQVLDEEEWETYEDYADRVRQFAGLLRRGERVYSGRSRSYLFVVISSYRDLVYSEGFREDTEHQYDSEDNRTALALRLKARTEDMMKHLISDGHVAIEGQDYVIRLGSTESVVRNFSKVLIGISESLAKARLTSSLKEKGLKDSLLAMAQTVRYIANLKGGDSSKVVQKYTRQLIDWYDIWSSPQYEAFETQMDIWISSARESNKQKRKFRDLAGKMNLLIGILEGIKSHVGYGVGFEDRTYKDLGL